MYRDGEEERGGEEEVHGCLCSHYSSKFYRKIHFIGNLQELLEHVPLNQFTIPEAILRFEFIHLVSAISSNDPSSSHPFYQH